MDTPQPVTRPRRGHGCLTILLQAVGLLAVVAFGMLGAAAFLQRVVPDSYAAATGSNIGSPERAAFILAIAIAIAAWWLKRK